MPIYEYACESCKRRQSFLVLNRSDFVPVCKYCGGKKLSRLISRVAVLRSEESRLEALADPRSWGDLDENNPASVARFMKKMGEAAGEDLGEEIEQAMEELEGSKEDTPDESGL